MTKIDIELAKQLLKLIDQSGHTLDPETAIKLYTVIDSIMRRYGYKLPPIQREHPETAPRLQQLPEPGGNC